MGRRSVDGRAGLERRPARAARSWSCRATARARGPAAGRSGSATSGAMARPVEDRREVQARAPSSGRPPARTSSRSTRPIISSIVRKPSSAISSRTSSAMKRKKVVTNSGAPAKRFRSSGSWVAMPTGQVLRWQTRIMTQPITTSGAVAKPNSSAPSSAAMTTSRPVLSCPSTWTTIRSRSLLRTSTCCVSARPSSHGTPPCLIEVSGDAPGAAVVAGDQHDVGEGLGHARRHRAHADLGDQLHVDARPRVRVLQVVDQLLQILDRVDVVVRRGRDQAHARRRVPHLGDPGVDLVPRELAALAGLGALGHLDLEIVAVDEVLAGHAEASRGDLLDRAPPPVAVRLAAIAGGVLAALARCSTCRRSGSWRWPGSRAPPG